ncbi:MAG: phosphotransferase [Acidobacteria bacterium]|nr:phosphotransferase [Acidobacteriota bacterium]
MNDLHKFPPAQQRLMEFIRGQGACEEKAHSVLKLAGDASARQYFRWRTGDNTSFVLAVYPQPFDSENFSYRQVYTLFRRIGVPVPEAHVFDGDRGIVLQQDLGDESLQRRLWSLPCSQWESLFMQAVDLMVQVQTDGTRGCDPKWEAARLAFDFEKLSFELDFFFLHYLVGYRGLTYDARGKSDLYAEFESIARQLASYPRYLTHRDYHCRNIMLLQERMYLVDFQDARMGPAAYDLVSLLKDSIDVPEPAIQSLVRYFLSLRHLSAEEARDFPTQFELMSVQRMLKALGTYGYQISVRRNPVYRQYLSGTLHRAHQAALRLKRFPAIQALLEREISG